MKTTSERTVQTEQAAAIRVKKMDGTNWLSFKWLRLPLVPQHG